MEVNELVKMDSYKSANNRIFYAIEKCIKALAFTKDDYQKIAKADRIRNASDYDDFYIVNKEETRELLKFTAEFLVKTEKYVKESYN